MTRALIFRRTAFGFIAAGATCAALALPSATADPGEPDLPTPETPATILEPTPPAPLPVDDCDAAGLALTISSVTDDLNVYFAAHPDVNQALIDAARQPAFIAVGQFDAYFRDHPQQADELRAIQAPLTAFKDRCGLQVAPTDALAVLAEV